MLGKLPPKEDARTLMLAPVLLDVAAPATWTYERTYPKLGKHPVPLLANDRIGDCTLVSAAHLQMGYEGAEHGRWPTVREDAIVAEYWHLTGGVDSGLYMLDVANHWRVTGIPFAGKRERIVAFGAVSPRDPETIRKTCALRLGLWIGLALPLTAQAQFDNGKPWTVVGGGASWNARPGTWGGHAVSCLGYTPSCLLVGTWGRVQKVSWAFFYRYADEAFGMIDVLDYRVNVGAIERYLADKTMPV